MAIYHLSAKIIGRKAGRSVVAAAAYRSGQELRDEQVGQTFDYTRKGGVEHTEILAPEAAPPWALDRAVLWNTVEQVEKRKDSVLAREIEVALPVELSSAEQVALVRDFARQQFVAKGMVVDLAVHRDNPENPHAHLLLTTRTIGPDGFGAKAREWNDKALLLEWRASWATLANEHLQRAGHEIRIDHRTLEAQGSELVPGRKIGVGLERQQAEEGLPGYLAERVAESRAIARENGERIVEDPEVALSALTHQRATFTHHDVARFLNTRTDGAAQFEAAYLKVTTSPELVVLGQDERGRQRYTTRAMLELERGMLERAERLAERREHGVSEAHRAQVLREGRELSAEQAAGFRHVTEGAGVSVLVGVAGAGKSTLLEKAAQAWVAEGYTVKGAALSGIAAENLEHASGIGSRTLASWSRSWDSGRDGLTSKDVLVIDEAGLVGTRQMAAVLERAEAAGAKVVLVGDAEQLQAIEAGAPFRGIAQQAGIVELTQVRRQTAPWQREATQALSAGRTAEALEAYDRAGHVVDAATRDEARRQMLTAWRDAGDEHPAGSRLMLAYTRDDVRMLNAEARAMRKDAGELGAGESVTTARGEREFAAGDRLYFLRNERALGVKNGSLGTVERIASGVLLVRLDGEEERRVVVDTKFYNDVDHGYAATVHKAQGATVDRTFVLASPHLDRHATYVALSRHREAAALYYGRDDFKGGQGPDAEARARDNLLVVLGRARPKELALDFLERAPDVPAREAPVQDVAAVDVAERARILKDALALGRERLDLGVQAVRAAQAGKERLDALVRDERSRQREAEIARERDRQIGQQRSTDQARDRDAGHSSDDGSDDPPTRGRTRSRDFGPRL